MSKFSGPRKSASIGDLQIKENYDQETKSFSPGYYEVRDRNGNPTGELLEEYQIRVYIPEDVDESGCGEPSIVLKRDQFINARALSQEERDRLPESLKGKVMCKLNVSMGRKQYPKKAK